MDIYLKVVRPHVEDKSGTDLKMLNDVYEGAAIVSPLFPVPALEIAVLEAFEARPKALKAVGPLSAWGSVALWLLRFTLKRVLCLPVIGTLVALLVLNPVMELNLFVARRLTKKNQMQHWS